MNIRTFLALELPEPIVDSVRAMAGDVRAAAEDRGVRASWAKVAQIHVTLRFFGDTDRPERALITDVVARVAEDQEPFGAELSRLGVFPNWRDPRVLWLGMQDPLGAMQRLHAALDEGLVAAGLGSDDKRPFRPHVTLARVRRGSPAGDALRQVSAPYQHLRHGPATLDTMVLFRSELRPTGAVYQPLQTFTLGE